jgi:hypothetical protein
VRPSGEEQEKEEEKEEKNRTLDSALGAGTLPVRSRSPCLIDERVASSAD